jgi:anhydro-N-acetylmuramic acid kinase
VRSLADAFRRFILPRARIEEVIVGGGGARNRFLMARLRGELPGLRFVAAGKLGVDEKAKEAFAFAVLAYHTWHGWPATLPSATGARRAVFLGTVVSGKPDLRG